jgi:2-methylcitrate dehydratase PrpD
MTITAPPARDLDRIAAFIAAQRYETLPAAVRERAALVLMDTVGVIIGGAEEPEVVRFAEAVRQLEAGRSATVLTHGFPLASPTLAAWVNGAAGIFLELDEGRRPAGHPAIHVVPAALAVAEHVRASGRDLLAAIALGYELPARIGQATRLREGVHSHGHWGAIGAAAACGKLLGFDAPLLRQAMSIAASMGMATTWPPCLEGATVRNTYAAVANHNGLMAALLAQSGFTGLRDPLPVTFGQILGERYDPDAALDGLGETWGILTNYFKFHACCAYNHPALDATVDLLNEAPLPPDQIERIIVETVEGFLRIGQHRPANQLAAKFSIPFAVATTIVNRSSGRPSFKPQVVADEAVQALADRVQVVADAEMTRRWPADGGARVTVYLRDGTQRSATCLNPRGSFQNPLGEEALVDKFLALTAAAFRDPQAAARALRNAADAPDVRALTDELRQLAA